MEVKREKKSRRVTPTEHKGTFHLGWKCNEKNNTMKLEDI